MREFRIGDRVKVINNGHLYSTYQELADEFGFTNYANGELIYKGVTGKIINIRLFVVGHDIAGIRLDDGREIIISFRGIQRINTGILPEEMFKM